MVIGYPEGLLLLHFTATVTRPRRNTGYWPKDTTFLEIRILAETCFQLGRMSSNILQTTRREFLGSGFRV